MDAQEYSRRSGKARRGTSEIAKLTRALRNTTMELMATASMRPLQTSHSSEGLRWKVVQPEKHSFLPVRANLPLSTVRWLSDVSIPDAARLTLTEWFSGEMK